MNEAIKVGLSKTTNNIIKVAAVVGAITVIAGGWAFYLNNLWKPKVEVLSVDFTNGVAVMKYDGKEIKLVGDAVYWLNADWGLRLGSIRKDTQETVYDRIELLKKGMVVEYLNR